MSPKIQNFNDFIDLNLEESLAASLLEFKSYFNRKGVCHAIQLWCVKIEMCPYDINAGA